VGPRAGLDAGGGENSVITLPGIEPQAAFEKIKLALYSG
jgi:hypothetical protein